MQLDEIEVSGRRFDRAVGWAPREITDTGRPVRPRTREGIPEGVAGPEDMSQRESAFKVSSLVGHCWDFSRLLVTRALGASWLYLIAARSMGRPAS